MFRIKTVESVGRESLQAATLLDTKQDITGVQLVEMLERVSGNSMRDPSHSWRYASLMSLRRQALARAPLQPEPFWLSPQLKRWNSNPCSSMVFVHGSFSSRFKVKDFSVALIRKLKQMRTPVLWAFPQDGSNARVRSINILQSLILQAIRLSEASDRTRTNIQAVHRLTDANTEGDWMDILFEILSGLPIVYIVFDASIPISSSQDFSWPFLISSFCQKLSKTTVVKVLFASYGQVQPAYQPRHFSGDPTEIIVRVDSRESGPTRHPRQSQSAWSTRRPPHIVSFR